MDLEAHIYTDIHERVDLLARAVEESSNSADLIILNGDFFDSRDHKDLKPAGEMAKYLRDYILPNRKFIVHWGNHDLQYSWSWNTNTFCTGGLLFERNKPKIPLIKKYLKREHWNQFKWFTKFGKYLISHAGINDSMLDFRGNFNETPFLDGSLNIKLDMGDDSYLSGCGSARGGRYDCGGIVWQDWNWEFFPISGINQIVGHTADSENPVREKNTLDSFNYCFDGAENFQRCILRENWTYPIFEKVE